MSASPTRHDVRTEKPSAVVVFLLVVGFAVSGLLVIRVSDNGGVDPSRTFSYTPHAVITIEGDADFASKAAAEGWAGNGNRNNPYIISGYDIDGLAYRDAVFIGNTTVYFVLTGCYIHNSNEAAIVLWNVVNAEISNNTCLDNYPWGIRLAYCSDSAVRDNVCSSQRAYGIEYASGIYITSCDSITLSDNDCSNNVFSDYYGSGILGIGCQNCVVNDNTCTGNSDCGIWFNGDGNLISVNLCADNDRGISFSGMSTAEGNICTGGFYGIAAGNDAVVRGNNCSDNTYGIYASGQYGTISLNNCTSNSLGIRLSGASYWSVLENNCSGNSVDGGIRLGDSTDHVTVDGNTCNDNIANGIAVVGQSSHVATSNIVTYNSCHGNSRSGIFTSYAFGTLIADNNCSFNERAGIELNGLYHTLRGNTMFGDGVVLSGGPAEWGLNSIDESNLVNTMPVYYLVDNVAGSVPEGKGQVILANCRYTRVDGVRVDNASVGILMGHCENVTISNSTAMWNSIAGISLVSSRYTGIDNVTCSHGQTAGIRLSSAWYTTISNSTCNYNQYGVRLIGSYYNTLLNNTCSYNTAAGIHIDMDWSQHNTVAYNRFENNTQYGVMVASGTFDLMAVNAASEEATQATEPLGASTTLMPQMPPQGGYNLFYGNTFLNNSAEDDDWGGGLNWWNISGYGNYWSDWQIPDANGDGIVDVPKQIVGGGSAMDYFPLTVLPPEPVPEFPVFGIAAVAGVVCVLVLGTRRLRRG